MTGYAVPGHMGFVAKDGEVFDYRLNVRFHRDVMDEAGALLHSGESLADFVRAAVREKIHRDTPKRARPRWEPTTT